MPRNWTVVRLPALAEEDDPLGRAVGAALWPERMDIDELELRRHEMGSRAFSAQFQQAPIPLDGLLFKSAWFEQRYTSIPADVRIVQTIDGAWKTGVSHDFSVIATWAATKTHFYLVDVWRRKVEFPALKAAAIAQNELYRPSKIVVEDAASGTAIIQALRAESALPVIAVSASGSKEARAEAITPLFEAGRVQLPHSAPWLAAWIEEHLRFPDGAHDDQVDTTSIALTELRKPRNPVTWAILNTRR